MSRIGDFNPRSPGGERLNNGVTPSNKVEFQSTLPGWGATHLHVGHAVRVDISIHAPRVGSDRRRKSTDCGHSYFNPRSPGGERRGASRSGSPGRTDFNPRSPDGERQRAGGRQDRGGDISIHAPRMGSDTHRRLRRLGVQISIHAPRMGSDDLTTANGEISKAFQSTLPGWGATGCSCFHRLGRTISIHAPRMGSDFGGACPVARGDNFNPRSPDGERLYRHTTREHNMISIHAPRMGSDTCCFRRFSSVRYFNPRSPDGERPLFRLGSRRDIEISIHAPRMGSDRENGHLRPRYGQNHPFSTLIVSQIVVDVLGTVRKSQKTPAH